MKRIGVQQGDILRPQCGFLRIPKKDEIIGAKDSLPYPYRTKVTVEMVLD